MRPSAPRVVAVLLAAATAACGGGSGSSPDPGGTRNLGPAATVRWPGPSYAQVQAVFGACTSCHGTNGGLSLASPGSWSNLVGVPAVASVGTRVVPNSSATSVLYARITGTGLARMPPGGALSASAIGTVKQWIDEGGARQDLSVSISGMSASEGKKVVLRVESDSGELRTKIVLDPLPLGTVSLFVPRVLPKEVHSLAIWADGNGNGAYDAPPADPGWRRTVPPSGALSFAPDAATTAVGAAAASEPGFDATLAFTAMTPHVGEPLTAAVYKKSSAPLDYQLVGLYRLGAVPGPYFTIVIPGVVAASQDYFVDLWADHSGNGTYDPPPADHAWRVVQSATGTGLDVSFTHGTAFTDVSVWP